MNIFLIYIVSTQCLFTYLFIACCSKEYGQGNFYKAIKNHLADTSIFIVLLLILIAPFIVLYLVIMLVSDKINKIDNPHFSIKEDFEWSNNWKYGQTINVNNRTITKLGKDLYWCGCQKGTYEELDHYITIRLSHASNDIERHRLYNYKTALQKLKVNYKK